MDLKVSFRIVAITSLLSILLTSCSTVPVTGRRHINLMSDTETVKIHNAQFEMYKATRPISNDPRMNEWLLNVGERLSQQVFWDMPLADWEFVVFKDPTVNAEATMGGKIYVNTGLFNEGIVTSEDELAAVVAHEIAHVTARHKQDMDSQLGLVEAASGIASLGTTIATGGMINVAAPSMAGHLFAYKRVQEAEADHIGIIYMAEAGFDPQAAITVMEKMAASYGGGGSTKWNDTHPLPEDRVDALHSYLEEATAAYEKAKELQF
jgi:predicted Zn-dependent protease